MERRSSSGWWRGRRRVIRYDHRDTGLSSTVDFAAHPYTVADPADDALVDRPGVTCR
ncbi:hypothetical protein [Streptomyces sp. DH12]|uniref:hypothetical protein n=1 Tax=Streptomyces sp. DH12 TaxID=2857010 RepID=UPI001E2A792E|nr:hypothetical protein [Streptomyces sp. DH12]